LGFAFSFSLGKIKFESLVLEITNEQLGLGFGQKKKKLGCEMRFALLSRHLQDKEKRRKSLQQTF